MTPGPLSCTHTEQEWPFHSSWETWCVRRHRRLGSLVSSYPLKADHAISGPCSPNLLRSFPKKASNRHIRVTVKPFAFILYCFLSGIRLHVHQVLWNQRFLRSSFGNIRVHPAWRVWRVLIWCWLCEGWEEGIQAQRREARTGAPKGEVTEGMRLTWGLHCSTCWRVPKLLTSHWHEGCGLELVLRRVLCFDWNWSDVDGRSCSFSMLTPTGMSGHESGARQLPSLPKSF